MENNQKTKKADHLSATYKNGTNGNLAKDNKQKVETFASHFNTNEIQSKFILHEIENLENVQKEKEKGQNRKCLTK